jgi:hypothetical protein
MPDLDPVEPFARQRLGVGIAQVQRRVGHDEDAAAGAERGKAWSGLHHIGFQVESLEAITEKLAAAGSEPRHDVNEALGVGHGAPRHENVEVKYSGPDGVMVDVSETGWVGTSSGFSVS